MTPPEPLEFRGPGGVFQSNKVLAGLPLCRVHSPKKKAKETPDVLRNVQPKETPDV